jgi:hypothetical protein
MRAALPSTGSLRLRASAAMLLEGIPGCVGSAHTGRPPRPRRLAWLAAGPPAPSSQTTRRSSGSGSPSRAAYDNGPGSWPAAPGIRLDHRPSHAVNPLAPIGVSCWNHAVSEPPAPVAASLPAADLARAADYARQALSPATLRAYRADGRISPRAAASAGPPRCRRSRPRWRPTWPRWQ